jgi:hypothetical protein
MRTVLVVVADELGQNLFKMTTTEDEMFIEASRLTVPKKRSAIAFAREARMGVLMIRMPSLRNTSSKVAVNFASRSRMRNRTARESLGEFGRQVAGLLRNPLPHPGLVVKPDR